MRNLRVLTLSIAVALLLIVMAQVSPVAAQPPACVAGGVCLGFPDADDTSGKFINVTRGLSSLGDVGTGQNVLNIFLIIPASQTDFELGIFDGDMGGNWDRFASGVDQLRWHLYPDPNRIGVTTGEIWTEAAAVMPDNDWYSTTVLNTEAARNGGAGDFYYHLVADWDTLLVANEQNNFKVAVEGTPYLPAGSTIGFEGFGPAPAAGGGENYPATTYDGSFIFRFYVPASELSLDLYDGDMDRWDDTDDANSPNLPPNLTGTVSDPLTTWPPFQTSAATRNPAEGANLGAPADDLPVGHPFRISPSVIYHVTAPDKSWTVTNQEPSGDKEWERFRILQAGAPLPADGLPADVTASSLPSGLYEWQWEGLDSFNTVFINLEYDLYPGLGSIGNTVWADNNQDGIWDPATEPGIPGVVVNLWLDVDENGSLDKNVDRYLKSLTTEGSNGFYKFTDLDRAKYLVEVDPGNFNAGGALAGYSQTPINYDETVGDDHNRSTPWPVTLPTNLYYPKADFGYYLCVPCVNGVTNMTLKLTFRTSSGDPNEWVRVRAGGLGGAVLYDSKTDALPGDGLPVGAVFSFDVPASATQVVVTVQGLNHASETVKSTFSAECNLVIGTENGNTYIKFKVMDAKLDGSLLCTAPPPTGKIGDRVWLDADGDGVQDSGETGINGVTVKLLNASNVVVTSQVTAGDGGYLFTGLAAGAYSVVVDAATLPAGLTQTFDADGVGSANQSSLSLAAGASNLDQDFGYKYNGKIGDRVWLDADGDGVQDSGESGINGVTVKLLNASNVVVTSQVTAGDGGYLFTGLAAGAYSVVVDAATLPAGLTQTFDADGIGTANQSSLSLAAGASNLNQDFGYKPTGVCVPCVNGVTNMTLKLTFRTSSGDPNEWIRVRAGGLGGAVLYDSKTDALPGDGLPVGAVFSFDVPASATQVVVTVQGLSHTSETVKSTFSAECNLVIGTENGNTYIKFKVMDAKFDGSLVCSAATLIDAKFDSSRDDFSYFDDTFRGTSKPSYAWGDRITSGGYTGGALRVKLGGIDNSQVLGMSGGWKRSFTLSTAGQVVVSVRYNLKQTANYESDEKSQMLMSVDGVLRGRGANDYVDQIAGDGNGGSEIATGWRIFEVNLGTLSAGTHVLIVGGYNNKKTYADESTQVLIDDVLVRRF